MSTIQVDRIIPYQSASVTIEGDIVQANAATTGSNTFVGDQNIQGTLTASIQEGYVLAGGAGDVSKLVATSSLSGDSFPYTGDAVISGSLTISGSSLYDLTVEGKQQIIGTVGIGAAAIPQLLISSSDFNTLISRNNIQFKADGASQSGIIGRGQLGLYAEPLQGATLLMTTYDEGFTEDVELFVTVDSPSGITVQDWDNSTSQYDDIFVIQPNVGTTPDVEFKRGLQVTGSVNVSGVVDQTFPVPATNLSDELIRVTGGVSPGTSPGAVYNYVRNSWNNAQFGNSYLGWTWENWDTDSFGFGNDTVIGPTGFFHDMYASGSGQNAQLRIRDNYNGTTFAQLYAGTLRLGNQVTTELTIGRSDLNSVISGSVSVEKVLTLAPQDPLPAGAVGQLAVSGSNLYFYTDQWKEVAFV